LTAKGIFCAEQPTDQEEYDSVGKINHLGTAIVVEGKDQQIKPINP